MHLFKTHYCPSLKAHRNRVLLATAFYLERVMQDNSTMWISQTEMYLHNMTHKFTLIWELMYTNIHSHLQSIFNEVLSTIYSLISSFRRDFWYQRCWCKITKLNCFSEILMWFLHRVLFIQNGSQGNVRLKN